jgi:hypothetical protein
MKKFITTVLICLMIGIGFAGLLGQMNTAGILVDEYLTATLTITDLQTSVILIWCIVGAIWGMLRR